MGAFWDIYSGRLTTHLGVHVNLKGLCHGQKCRHLFSDSEAYHEQMGPIPSSNGSLDRALSIVHT